MPYYLKVDIETADRLRLEALQGLRQRPRYVSIELDLTISRQPFLNLRTLWDPSIGVSKFVNRKRCTTRSASLARRRRAPTSISVSRKASVPSGKRPPGPWLSSTRPPNGISGCKQRQHLSRSRTRQGRRQPGRAVRAHAQGHLHRVYARSCSGLQQRRGHLPSGWYDLHAPPAETPGSITSVTKVLDANPKRKRKCPRLRFGLV